jgi:hypothetical protein
MASQGKRNIKTGTLIVLQFCILTRKYRSASAIHHSTAKT